MTTEPARKLEIFVGATRRDLGPARQAVINAILEKGHIPSGMELWSAGNPPPLEIVADHLERCDAHILLLGARYGSLLPDSETISFTEWEYQQSKDSRPILAFLYDHDSLRRARGHERDPLERKKATRAKLDRLRAELLRTKHVKEFHHGRTALGELQKDAVLAIGELASSDELSRSSGWIRGDSLEARTGRDIANNPFLKRELDQLRRFSTLGARVGLDVASKQALARAFWSKMQGRIRRCKYSYLFFESGSTVAYLSDEFVNTVLVPGHSTHRWHIRTNNVLSLVYFDLHTPIDASRFPSGIPDPEDQYGAIFPNEWRQLLEPPPLTPRALYRGGRRHMEERDAVDEMRRRFALPHRKQLVLAAASGLDLTHAVPHFRGPHVGSHPNMLFKRAIFTSGYPVVLFMSAEKLGNPFRLGKCYPVFGPDEPWKAAASKYPIAICVGYESPKKSKPTPGISEEDVRQRNDAEYIRDSLHELGFSLDYFAGNTPRDSNAGAILCGNKPFAKLIPSD